MARAQVIYVTPADTLPAGAAKIDANFVLCDADSATIVTHTGSIAANTTNITALQTLTTTQGTSIAANTTAVAGVSALLVPVVQTYPNLIANYPAASYPSYTAVVTDSSGNQQTVTSNGTVWTQPLSSTYDYLNCVASSAASDRYFIGIKGQEPSVLTYNGYYNYFYTDGNGHVSYSYCATSADPTVAANWAATVTAIGGGTGGASGACAHSYAILVGSTIYVYGYETGTKNVLCLSAATTTASVPTFSQVAASPLITGVPGGGTSGGNLCVTYANGSQGLGYYIHYEALHGTTNPGEGSTNSWQTTAYFSATIGTALTSLNSGAILNTLRTTPNASASMGDIKIVGTTAVMYYHGGGWGRQFPNDLYRATMPVSSLGTDAWVIERGFPGGIAATNGYGINPYFMRRAHFFEFDQIADAFVWTGVNGIIYMSYTACNNRIPNYIQMITTLQPSNKIIDGSFNRNQQDSHFANRQYWDLTYPTSYQNYPPPMASGMSNIAVVAPEVTGTWNCVYTASAPDGVIRTNTSAASNDDLRWDVPLMPGTYAINIGLQTGPANGIATLYIYDGYATGVTARTQDCYSASIAYINFATTWVIYGYEPFNWRFRLLCNTKNASSTGYTLGDCGISIVRTGN